MQGSAPVKLDKLTGTDGFVVTDLADATTSVGIARLAPKVLREGVELLARSVTYAFASFGVAGHGGASGAIKAKTETRDEAVDAFVEAVRVPAEAETRMLGHGP